MTNSHEVDKSRFLVYILQLASLAGMRGYTVVR